MKDKLLWKAEDSLPLVGRMSMVVQIVRAQHQQQLVVVVSTDCVMGAGLCVTSPAPV